MNGLKTTGIILSFLILIALGSASPAAAHRVRLFATVEGDTIQGYGYFSQSNRTKNCPVIFYGPKGKELGRVMTNDKGEFSYKPRVRCDLRLVLKGGEGHQAEFMIRAAELPENQNYNDNATDVAGSSGRATPQEASAAGPSAEIIPSGKGPASVELSRIVSSAVAREIGPLKRQITALREQLDEYEAKIRWHDVLGGIGFILGLAGMGLLVMNRHRNGKG